MTDACVTKLPHAEYLFRVFADPAIALADSLCIQNSQYYINSPSTQWFLLTFYESFFLKIFKFLLNINIHSVTGSHRQKIGMIGHAERIIFCEGTFTRNQSFLSYAHVSRCARHSLEPTDQRLMYADDIMICAVSPHSVVAIRSA